MDPERPALDLNRRALAVLDDMARRSVDLRIHVEEVEGGRRIDAGVMAVALLDASMPATVTVAPGSTPRVSSSTVTCRTASRAAWAKREAGVRQARPRKSNRATRINFFTVCSRFSIT